MKHPSFLGTPPHAIKGDINIFIRAQTRVAANPLSEQAPGLGGRGPGGGVSDILVEDVLVEGVPVSFKLRKEAGMQRIQ